MMMMPLTLTQMDGRPVMISMYGVKMIEEITWTPEMAKGAPKASKDSAPAPVTTQAVVPPSAEIPAVPVVCSMITFHDDKTFVVKETMTAIASMSGPVPHSI
jgi:hypothetical protein